MLFFWCKLNLIKLYKMWYMLKTKSNSWQIGVPAWWIQQVLPKGEFLSLTSLLLPYQPHSWLGFRSSICLWVVLEVASWCILSAFRCPQLMSLMCILTEHLHSLAPCQAKPRLELKNPPSSAVLKALWHQESPQLADVNTELVPFQDTKPGFWGIKRALINTEQTLSSKAMWFLTWHIRETLFQGWPFMKKTFWHRIIWESAMSTAHHSFFTCV